MISTHALVGIALIELGMVLTPGPNMLHLISRSVTQGRHAGLISLSGVAAGFFVYLLAATAGVVTLFALVPALYTALKIAGAGYLLWLAWTTVRPGGRSALTPSPLTAERPHKLFLTGALTNLLNPKIAVLYVSLLPQFIDPAAGHIAAQTMSLGLTQICVALAVNGLIVFGAGRMAAFLAQRPTWLRVQRGISGAMLAGFAFKILFDRSRPLATP